jgi:WD repeat and SOF domain-containing protein 1
MKIKALSRPASSIQAPGSNVSNTLTISNLPTHSEYSSSAETSKMKYYLQPIANFFKQVTRTPRNLDPSLHPFEKAREYTRALNATKMERMFAQPFLGDLGRGHVDGVYKIEMDPEALDRLASGSGDGVIKVWDLPGREEVFQAQAHSNIVRGLSWVCSLAKNSLGGLAANHCQNRERKLLSCGGSADRSIKLWDPYTEDKTNAPIATWLGKEAYTSISHHRSEPTFAVSSSSGIGLYDTTRPGGAVSSKLQWPNSVDTITSVAFNQVETSILASCASDRSVVLYDLRTSSPLAKTTLTLACNAIAWNPMEGFNLALASEDHNIYIFDMRKMNRASNVLKDHVAAVMDVKFSPTGEELVSASYDRSIRLWRRDQGHSRDIYHTKRMQRVFSCAWTPGKFKLVNNLQPSSFRSDYSDITFLAPFSHFNSPCPILTPHQQT